MTCEKQKILTGILKEVPRHGWTDESFNVASKKACLSPAKARRLFPRGMPDVIAAFHQSIDEAMRERIHSKRNFKTMRTRDKIAFAVRARLESIDHHQEAMQRLIVWSLMPRNIAQASNHLWQVAGMIWEEAGDQSTDYNYYTKRLLLIFVMKSTLAFWLGDRSSAHHDTWIFLDRRIEEVLMMGKTIGMLKSGGLSDILSLMRRAAPL